MNPKQKIDWKIAAALVRSSIIRTGEFTSLGFQLADILNTEYGLNLGVGRCTCPYWGFIDAELGTNFKTS